MRAEASHSARWLKTKTDKKSTGIVDYIQLPPPVQYLILICVGIHKLLYCFICKVLLHTSTATEVLLGNHSTFDWPSSGAIVHLIPLGNTVFLFIRVLWLGYLEDIISFFK